MMASGFQVMNIVILALASLGGSGANFLGDASILRMARLGVTGGEESGEKCSPPAICQVNAPYSAAQNGEAWDNFVCGNCGN